MIALGIETSCDETAASVVNGERRVLSNLVLSQLEEHKTFGGVVPEIAARAHLEHLDTLIAAALHDAGIGYGDLNAVAATCGPGLIGGVMVGMMAGKAISLARNIPFIGVNHLEAHVLTPRLTDDVKFPYLVLLVSGGHTQILVAEDVGIYKLWGSTIDDALGECFDKCAKLLGLPHPGGPNLERAALTCADPARAAAQFPLPRPMHGRKEPDFSFSGLKTAVRTHAESLAAPLLSEQVAAIASSFQDAVCDVLRDRCGKAIARFRETYDTPDPAFIVCGGVAANTAVRETLADICAKHGMTFSAPPLKLCGDNGAMIAWAGIERLRRGMADDLSIAARPRWPLDETQGERGRR